MPHLAFDLLVLGALYIYDRRTLGRAHPVLLSGGGCLIAAQALRHLAADTAAWHAVTDFLIAIGA